VPDASDNNAENKAHADASQVNPDGARRSWRERLDPRGWTYPKLHAPHWRTMKKTERIGLISVGAVLGLILVGWIGLNFALANPRIATPVLNWGLHAFGNKSANVATGRLEHPFGSRFLVRTLDWPGRVEAEDITVRFDLLGFLPGRPWAREVRVRDGEVMLDNDETNPSTIHPEDYVDRIDAQNVVIRFTRRGKPREVTILTASGAFSNASLKAEAVAGRSRLTFDGLARKGGGFGGHVTARGENLKDLAEIVGASAPDTPPFNVTGELATHMRTWDVTKLRGRIGDSDIGGEVKVDLRQKKPFLTVDLKSRELDFDDLGVVFGIPVGAGRGETTNAEQRASKAAFDRSARLIPNTRIDFARLKAVNADISFDAAAVKDAPSGITAMTLKGTLRDQVLDFGKVLVKTSTGDMDAKIRIDASRDPAHTKASGTLQKVSIQRIIKSPFIRGTLSGRFALDLTGSGFREAAGTATGEAGVWSTDSELAHIATEAAGLDLGEILLDLAKEDDGKREYLKSRCLAANLAFADGRVQLAPAVLDNKDSLITATGGADLKTEALNLKIRAAPHDVSIGKLFGDINIGGTLRHPDLKAPGPKVIVQTGIAALLSSIAGPLAALPFIEIGGGPDAPCGQLLADARDAGQSQDPRLRKKSEKS
jgi:hypothetical protein